MEMCVVILPLVSCRPIMGSSKHCEVMDLGMLGQLGNCWWGTHDKEIHAMALKYSREKLIKINCGNQSTGGKFYVCLAFQKKKGFR